MMRANHLSNTKRGGVCMYYKKYLPLIGEIDICKLNECIVTKITANNESFFDMSLQITKSQSNAV